MALYYHTANITFRGQFPVDMLRYDRVYPLTENDSGIIERSHEDPIHTVIQKVQVATITNTKTAPWTVARWESFGASVENVSTHKQ